MNSSLNITTSIFDELLRAVEAIGIEKTIKTLQEAKNNILILEDKNVSLILETVSKVTGVSKDRIINGNDRKTEERKMALATCIYFIKKECSYSFPDIKMIFNKDESQLSRYYSLVENIPSKPKTFFDKKLDEIVKKVKILLTQNKL